MGTLEHSRKPPRALGRALGLSFLALAAAARTAEPDANVGEHIYTTLCQGCHMSKGEGAVGAGFYPKLAADPALASWQYVATVVLNGRHGMPGFGSSATSDASNELAMMSTSLSNAEVADVVNYVRTHFGNNFKDKATAKEVATLQHPGGDQTHGHAG